MNNDNKTDIRPNADIGKPSIAKKYWQLDEDATLLDVVKVIRADEMTHRELNHMIADKLDDEVTEPVIHKQMNKESVTKLKEAYARDFFE